MHELPDGTVTFLFTDIEASTRLWHAHPDTMPAAYARHDAILREAVATHHGVVFKTVGDAFQVAFPTAVNGVTAALEAQRNLQRESWVLPDPLKVRMALHTGAVDPDADGDYRSPVLNRLGRLLGASHGGQALVSQATMELTRDHLPDGVTLHDLGEQRLKDLYRPERVWQLTGRELETDFAPLRTLDTRPNNLPTQLTQFIGRHDDVDALRDLLRRDDVRLVTLTGPGGMGKTRLALQTGADVLDAFADGVYLVELDTITDPALVPAAIASAFGLREEAETAIGSTLEGYLRDRRLLLILDNLEQVIEAATSVRELLVACSGLKVLATSRLRLQISGEREYAVRPLDLPKADANIDMAALTQYDGVRLFIERAEAVKSDFTVTRENAPAIAEICTRLDGLPLAIELAAARVRILPPEALLRRLEMRLPLLTGGSRDLPVRQQTLRGAIAWSYELLTPGDRALFRRLSVFAGGASFEAIERVVAGDGPAWDVLEVLEGLERLVDQSLVRQTEISGEPRFSMFETIREFGLDELDTTGEAEEAHQSHASFFADVVATYRWEFSIEEMAAWLDRIETEHDNVRAALTWTLAHDPTLAVRIAGFAARYWLWRSHFREGHTWLERALAHHAPDMPLEDRARALRVMAVFEEARGDWTTARTALEDSQVLFETIGDRRQQTLGLSQIGTVLGATGDQHGAIEVGHASVEMAREYDDSLCLCWSLNNLGVQAYDYGDFDLARTSLQEALEVIRDIPSMYASTVWNTAADIFRVDGDMEQAERLYIASLRDGWTGRLVSLVVACLIGLVMTAVDTKRWDRAARLAGAEAALRRQGDNALDPNLTEIATEYDQHLARAMDAMERDTFRAAWEAGAATPLADLVAELVAEHDTDDPDFPYAKSLELR